MSSCKTAQLMAMQHYADKKDLTKFISYQPLHSPVYQEEARDAFLACKVSLALGAAPFLASISSRPSRTHYR